MSEKIVESLKLIFKPSLMYYGEWELCEGLEKISLDKKGKLLFEEFLERYYYIPLMAIFKDEELVKKFRCGVCSKGDVNGRNLYFSRKTFLRSVITNADAVINSRDNDEVYKEIKQAIRLKKELYRDVYKNGKDSKYYKDVNDEYLSLKLTMTFDEFVKFCKKKYTRLLSGYNVVLELFNKPIDVEKFIKCFDVNKLYLFTVYSLLTHAQKHYDIYGRLDYCVNIIEDYKKAVLEFRKEEEFYNSFIILDSNIIYTIDDLIKNYDKFIRDVSEK